jgi:hypothetical protein
MLPSKRAHTIKERHMSSGLFKRSTRIAVVLGISALLLLLFFTAACAPLGNHRIFTPAPKSTSTPASEQGLISESPVAATEDIEDWLVFDDPELACSFNYPISATIESGRSPQGIYTVRLQFQISGVDGYQGMVIQVVPIDNPDELDVILKQVYESSSQTLPLDEWLEELEPTTVGALPGYRTTCALEATDFSIIIPQENRVFVITPSHDMAATCADPKALSIFYRVLETLLI